MRQKPVERIRESEDFAVAYRAESERVLGYFYRRTADAETALDLTAETFAKAWKIRRRYRPELGSIGAWLNALANQELLHYWRHQRVSIRARQKMRLPEMGYEPDELAEVERRYDAERMAADLAQQMSRLTSAERSALHLRVERDLGYPVVAAELGCSEGAARVRVSRALAKLQAGLTQGEPA